MNPWQSRWQELPWEEKVRGFLDCYLDHLFHIGWDNRFDPSSQLERRGLEKPFGFQRSLYSLAVVLQGKRLTEEECGERVGEVLKEWTENYPVGTIYAVIEDFSQPRSWDGISLEPQTFHEDELATEAATLFWCFWLCIEGRLKRQGLFTFRLLNEQAG